MTAQIKAIIASLIVLVLLIVAALIYWRGSSNATTKADLHTAREVITTERETRKVTTKTNERVDAESVQTAKTAEAADHEIEAIRNLERAAQQRTTQIGASHLAGTHVTPTESTRHRCDYATDPAVDPGAARVLQLAREARAAALASSGRLQPARAGAR